MNVERICSICGTKFLTTVHNKTMCSRTCVRKYRNDWMKKSRVGKPMAIRHKKCVVCSEEFSESGKALRITCSEKCQRIRASERSREYWRDEKHQKWYKAYSSLPEVKKRNCERSLRHQKSEAYKNRMKALSSNPEFRLLQVLRTTLTRRMKIKKQSRTSFYVGYTPEQLRGHLERMLKPGMTWKNYGRSGWHIDHIKPLTSFKFMDENGTVRLSEIRKAMDLSNLQPMWAAENIRKGNRIPVGGERTWLRLL